MSVKLQRNSLGLSTLLLGYGGERLQLSLQGAHITSYVSGGVELLWVSRNARYAPGQAIRGGIPLCWPWFGASMDDPSWPQHGFARISNFQLVNQEVNAQYTSVLLALDHQTSISEWMNAARLEVEIRLSDHLWMELRTTNVSTRELLIGAGLHNYFAISDRMDVSIPDLTGMEYRDKTQGFSQHLQAQPLALNGEIDRVYLNPPHTVEMIDSGNARGLIIHAWGHTDLVVWNPGLVAAAAIPDFDDDGHRQMICIEPAIALDHRKALQPGQSLVMGQSVRRNPDLTAC